MNSYSLISYTNYVFTYDNAIADMTHVAQNMKSTE
jgi:hypothetical protein